MPSITAISPQLNYPYFCTLFARSGGAAIAVTFAGAFFNWVGVAGTGAVAVAITRADTGVLAGVLAGISSVVVCEGLVRLFQGDIGRGLALGIGSVVGLGFAAIAFFEVVKGIETSGEN
ncbi:MAG: hypothetical protein RID09_08850 [Coleofasciculus sp. G1-WW12-02]|uniref:hypothetical protein n=1 Tax=Coleofasciculus sp. G1-WW12-02 TaxID=3068483 RepID=UPI0032FF3C1C